jgi:MYXO-CTERM domain-containing protein
MAQTASAEPVTVMASLPSPGDSASGLGWDGSSLWVSNLMTSTGGGKNRVSRLDPRTGVELSGFDMQASDVFHGMAFDSQGNLYTDNFNKSFILDTDIVVLDPDGALLDVYPAQGTIYGVALDAETGRLFQVDNHSVEDGGSDMNSHLYELDASDGSVVRGPIELQLKRARGVAWDGQALWVASNLTDSIYRIDVETGAIMYQFVAPGAGGVEGLAYDGSCLWISDTRDDIIYRVDHGQPSLPDCVPFGDPEPEPDPDTPDDGNPDSPDQPDDPTDPNPDIDADDPSAGCSASSGSSPLWFAALLLALVFGRRRLLFAAVALFVSPACNSTAQEEPPPAIDEPDAGASCDDPSCAWLIETIDKSSLVAGTTSVALDSSGHPHVAYLDVTNDDLRYAWFDGASWTLETVDRDGLGWHASLALDAQDRPHIVHYDFSNSDLKYATRTADGWQTETIDSEGFVGRKPSIEIDDGGRIHVSYHDTGLDDLKYAVRDGAWSIETIDSVDWVGDHTSLALDSSGSPHISYFFFKNREETEFGSLRYAHRVGSDWVIESVDEDGVVGHFTSIALDANGAPHISYRDDTNKTLKYAHLTQDGWQSETVDADGDLGDYNTSIAIDSAGHPHISYHDVVAGSLRYARLDGADWTITTIDDEPFSGHYSSLALDDSDRPHLTYSARDDVSFPGMATRIELKYARSNQ